MQPDVSRSSIGWETEFTGTKIQNASRTPPDDTTFIDTSIPPTPKPNPEPKPQPNPLVPDFPTPSNDGEDPTVIGKCCMK